MIEIAGHKALLWFPWILIALVPQPSFALPPQDRTQDGNVNGDFLWCTPWSQTEWDLEPEAPTSVLQQQDEAIQLQEAQTAMATRNPSHEALEGALVVLRHIRGLHPELKDVFDLMEGEWRMKSNPDASVCHVLQNATSSITPTIAVRAKLLLTQCLIHTDLPKGEKAFDDFLDAYPEHPNRFGLMLLLAEKESESGQHQDAIKRLRSLDLLFPYRRESRDAVIALERLHAAGQHVRPLSSTEKVERAERLVRQGSVAEGQAAIDALLAQTPPLPVVMQKRLHYLAARIARLQAKWLQAKEHLIFAGAVPPNTEGAPIAEQIQALNGALQSHSERTARAQLYQLLGRTLSLRSANTSKLLAAIRIAARIEDREIIHQALERLIRLRAKPMTRLEAVTLVSGIADHELIFRFLEPMKSMEGAMGMKARYFRARSMEHLNMSGYIDEYRFIIEHDQSSAQWYGLLSQVRLDAKALPTLDPAMAQPGPEALPSDETISTVSPFPSSDTSPHLASLFRLGTAHKEAFPWLLRAHRLFVLKQDEIGWGEIRTAVRAYHEAMGNAPSMSGALAVYKGRPPSRIPANRELWRMRRLLHAHDKTLLAEICVGLGDAGLGYKLNPTEGRPKPYADLVFAAARKHRIDPYLLWSVMRVESIYNSQIISYAGAIGLLQIMPKTGRLIAKETGVTSFNEDDLLDPNVNIDFSAWYLGSLLKRFEGRVALAVASYNGGPHNVRKWMLAYSSRLNMDAFLEHIPFDQTHKYVRKVLHHYAGYRRDAGLRPFEFHDQLPARAEDPVGF